MEKELGGSGIPPQESEGKEPDIAKILSNAKLGIDDLEQRLGQLPAEGRHKIQWLPNNIQEMLKGCRELDQGGEFSEQIQSLQERFDEIIERFDLDRKYFHI